MIRKFFIFYIILHVQFSYANEFEKGMFALEMEDYERAVYYLSFEAVQGNPRAQYNLGLMYKNGIGVKKDFNEALGWFILGSNNDHMLSKYALGLMYYKGEGVSKNYSKAMNLFLFSPLLNQYCILIFIATSFAVEPLSEKNTFLISLGVI